MTIREAIKMYTKLKMKMINNTGRKIVTYDELIHHYNTCVIIPLNNGVRIFIDENPNIKQHKDEYGIEVVSLSPNKNGIWRKLSFEILDDKEPVISKSFKKYVSISKSLGSNYFVYHAKEKDINEFISDNGGIAEDKFEMELLHNLGLRKEDLKEEDLND